MLTSFHVSLAKVFNMVFNPSNSSTMRKEDEEEKETKHNKGIGAHVTTAVLFTVGAACLVGWGAFCLLSALGSVGEEGSDGEEKLMKAPGRDAYIRRGDFEDNPRGYFRDLRGKSRD